MNWTTLISCEQVRAELDAPGMVIVDMRHTLSDPDAGERSWRQERLPGAVYAHLDRDLSDHHRPASEGRHPLPEAGNFCLALARLGITPDTQVVAYDACDGAMAAARLWWLMRLLGHSRVAVLDGGFAQWQALGLPTERGEPIEVNPRAAYPMRAFDATQIVDAEQVAARLQEAPGRLLDARGSERFRGELEPIDPVAGHIPGAFNRPFSANLRDGRFRSPEELHADFSALIGSRAPNEIFLNCGSGVTACQNLLAMEYAGLHGARVYAGSWSGWISDRTRSVATGS